MNDKVFMRRAIELAEKGRGWTAPNPLVGAVIVKNNEIIGEGFHERCGELHAERNAFKNLKESAEGATLYVTLEPCCHFGKTPPCTEAIIENKIKRVVIGSRDPNPLVSGKGAALLRENGIEVIEDYLKGECDVLNPFFFHHIKTQKPYVALKYAMTLDGKIATKTGASKWITGEKAREHVHQLRNDYQGILVGIGTVLADDPMLNCRIENGHQPVRIVVDSHLRIPLESQIVKTAKEFPTLIATVETDHEKINELESHGVKVISVSERDGHVNLPELIEILGQEGLNSILIEGGAQIHEAALRSGIVNHIYAYVAPKVFGGNQAKSPVGGLGIELPDEGAFFDNLKVQTFGEDVLLEYDLVKGMKDVYWNR